jgi:hypothetical protein
MDMHEGRLKALHRAARKCGVGPMLLISPGTIQKFAEGRVAIDLEDTRSQPPWSPAGGPSAGGAEFAVESEGPRWHGSRKADDGGPEEEEGGESLNAYEPDDLEAAMSKAESSGTSNHTFALASKDTPNRDAHERFSLLPLPSFFLIPKSKNDAPCSDWSESSSPPPTISFKKRLTQSSAQRFTPADKGWVPANQK